MVLPTPPFWFATAMMRVMRRAALEHDDEMALRRRGRARRARIAALQLDTSAAARDLLVRMHALHRDERAVRRAHRRPASVDEVGEVGERARDDDVERLRRLPVLRRARSRTLDVGERELDRRLPQERALLVVAVEQRHARCGPRDRERNAGQAGAAADVDARVAPSTCGSDSERVEQVVR